MRFLQSEPLNLFDDPMFVKPEAQRLVLDKLVYLRLGLGQLWLGWIQIAILFKLGFKKKFFSSQNKLYYHNPFYKLK